MLPQVPYPAVPAGYPSPPLMAQGAAPTDFLSARVSELTSEKQKLRCDLDASRNECAGLRKQVSELKELCSVLEEGQNFLLQKHRQVVSEYHHRLRKVREEAKAATDEAARAMNEATASQQHLLMQQQQLQQHHQQQDQQHQRQMASGMRVDDRVEVAQLLGVIEDLQRAIDEKNELIDMMSGQVSQAQQMSSQARAKQEELSQELTLVRAELVSSERKVRDLQQQANPSSSPLPPPPPSHPSHHTSHPSHPSHTTSQPANTDETKQLEMLNHLLEKRESARDAQMQHLMAEVATLRQQLSDRSNAPAAIPTPAPLHPSVTQGPTPADLLHQMRSRPLAGGAPFQSPQKSPPRFRPATPPIEARSPPLHNSVRQRVSPARRTPSPLARIAQQMTTHPRTISPRREHQAPLLPRTTTPTTMSPGRPRPRALYSPPKPLT
eukprot:Sspe_Gene.85229::Locus_56022_Transcript_1_1_Confidence_1.000_Length_1470::g.85229::m.85229